MDEIKIRCSCCGKKITRDDVYFKVVLIDESNNAGIRDYFCEENTMIMIITQTLSTIKRTL